MMSLRRSSPVLMLVSALTGGCSNDANPEEGARSDASTGAGGSPTVVGGGGVGGSSMTVGGRGGSDSGGKAEPGSADAARADARSGSTPEGGAGAGLRARMSLVDHELWTLMDGTDDPFRAERPDGASRCEEGSGYGAEAFEVLDPPNSAFFISTLWCDYATFEQPSLVDVLEGDTVELSIWRSNLESPAGSSVHVALQVGDDIGWEETVDIPAGSAAIRETWTATEAIPVGAPVRLHLHNHGANEYVLRSLTTGPPP